jgi:hypothetical protein
MTQTRSCGPLVPVLEGNGMGHVVEWKHLHHEPRSKQKDMRWRSCPPSRTLPSDLKTCYEASLIKVL